MSKPSKPWTNTPLRRAIFAKTNGYCFYCGLPIRCTALDESPRDWLLVKDDERLMVPEHATPTSRGGTNAQANLLPACRACNNAKGSLTLREFRYITAFRSRDPSFVFAGEKRKEIKRDWLCIYSDDQERAMFLRAFPKARNARFPLSGANK